MLQPKQTPKEKKNTKDATQMKNMRPTGPKTGRVKPTMGTAKNGTSMKKAQGGVTQKGKSVMKAYVDKYKGSGGLSDTYDVSRDTLGGNSPRDQYYNGGFGGTRMKQINDLEAAHDKKFGKNSTVDERKNGGKVTKAKNGKSFPDLNKDGKITKADVLKGRGVIAKKGATIKKAQDGALTYTNPRGKQYSLPQGASGPLNITRPNGSTRTIENREKYTKKMKRVFDRNTVDGVRQGTMTDTRQKNGGVTKKAKSGASMKKCKYGCK